MWSEEKTADQKLPDAVQAVRTFHERIAVGAMEDAHKLILESALETLGRNFGRNFRETLGQA